MREGENGQPPRAADSPTWVGTAAMAARLSVTTRQLEAWRSAGSGPPYVKLGRRIRYNLLLVEQWMAKRLQTSTAEVRP